MPHEWYSSSIFIKNDTWTTTILFIPSICVPLWFRRSKQKFGVLFDLKESIIASAFLIILLFQNIQKLIYNPIINLLIWLVILNMYEFDDLSYRHSANNSSFIFLAFKELDSKMKTLTNMRISYQLPILVYAFSILVYLFLVNKYISWFCSMSLWIETLISMEIMYDIEY